MAKQDAYASWHACAQEVERIARSRSIPLWQKAYRVGAAYSAIELDGLRSKHRHKIFHCLAEVNAVLARYRLDSFDDYQTMDETDLREIVRLFRSLRPTT